MPARLAQPVFGAPAQQRKSSRHLRELVAGPIGETQVRRESFRIGSIDSVQRVGRLEQRSGEQARISSGEIPVASHLVVVQPNIAIDMSVAYCDPWTATPILSVSLCDHVKQRTRSSGNSVGIIHSSASAPGGMGSWAGW